MGNPAGRIPARIRLGALVLLSSAIVLYVISLPGYSTWLLERGVPAAWLPFAPGPPPRPDRPAAAAGGAVPRPGEQSTWAIVPLPFPKDLPVDGYTWRVFYDCLALALTGFAGKPCIDPVEAETRTGRETGARAAAGALGELPLEKVASLLGVNQLLVPCVATAEPGGPVLKMNVARFRAGSPEPLLQTLVTCPLHCSDPVETERLLLDSVAMTLQALGARLPAARPEEVAFDPMPPEPGALLGRLHTRGRALNSRPWEAVGLAGLGQDYASLGYLLTQMEDMPGPRLLVRGTALCELASLLAGDSRTVMLARAWTRLLSRHTASALRCLAPLLNRGDPIASGLAEACRARPEALAGRPGSAFLLRVAAERAGCLPALGREAGALLAQGLPLSFLAAGATRSFPTTEARRLATEWLGRGCLGEGANSPRAIGGPRPGESLRTWYEGRVQAQAMALPKAMDAKTPSLPPAARPELSSEAHRRLEQELLVLPAAEFAWMSLLIGGAADERRAVLDSAGNRWATSLLLDNTGSALEAYERGGPLEAPVSRRLGSDCQDPWSGWPTVFSWPGKCEPRAGTGKRRSWDLGSVSQRRIHQTLDGRGPLPDGGTVEHSAGAAAYELLVDPFDDWLWTRRMRDLARSSTWDEARARADSRAAEAPWSDASAALTAELLRAHGLASSAERVLVEAVTRAPLRHRALQALAALYADGWRLDRLESLLSKRTRGAPDLDERELAKTLADCRARARCEGAGAQGRPANLIGAAPSPAAGVESSRDRAFLDSVLDEAEAVGDESRVDDVARNPQAEAVEALLSHVASPLIGRRCALALSARALLDLRLPELTRQEDLLEAHAKLQSWWATARAGYLDALCR